jgi:hypothetical protein
MKLQGHIGWAQRSSRATSLPTLTFITVYIRLAT